MPRRPSNAYAITDLVMNERPGERGAWDLGSWQGWAHHPSLDPFGLEFRAEIIDGALELTDLRIRSTQIGAEPTPIRSTTMRGISLTALLTAIRRELQEREEAAAWRTRDPAELGRIRKAVARSLHDEPQSRLSDDYLRALAEQRLSLNGQKAPNMRLAREWNVPTATITDHLNEATNRGFLLRTRQGVQRREPGPRLRLQADHHEQEDGEAQ